jgi:hypothetical protein
MTIKVPHDKDVIATRGGTKIVAVGSGKLSPLVKKVEPDGTESEPMELAVLLKSDPHWNWSESFEDVLRAYPPENPWA